ncbi:uncharacterized protein LOC123664680 [Melitaea cinxia]|uniref:uncharacterized protein LOC123664680 n=1 Tax=Melitaea cinxia TaxID=113334 RepID=UPI001E2748B8|nr:uncharacterized protein LOC123664680 [Melitaea cinxia]
MTVPVTVSMEWKTDLIFQFLSLYQTEPLLWNTLSMEHKNKDDTYDAWKRIKQQLGDGNIPIKEIKRKRDNLMSTYRRLRSKVEKSKLMGEEELYKPDWPFYHVMAAFLDDMYNPRKLSFPDSSYKDESHSCNEEENLKTKPATAKRQKTQNNKKFKKIKEDPDDQMNEDDIVSGNQDECALYTQLLCKKLQTLKETTREIAMLEIDRYIYNLKQQEKSNLVLVTPTLMDPLVGQYSPRYHLSPNSEYSSVSQHTPEYKPEYPITFSPNSSQQAEEKSESQASNSQHSLSAS